MEAQKALAGEGMPVRVVSMPSTSVFDRQDAAYRDGGAAARRAARRGGGGRHAISGASTSGLEGAVVGIDRYGESAPAGERIQAFRFHRGERG